MDNHVFENPKREDIACRRKWLQTLSKKETKKTKGRSYFKSSNALRKRNGGQNLATISRRDFRKIMTVTGAATTEQQQ
uniref:THAP-type domain-containing protein n=1 Tax=Panagrellus redivivus TaxID=6233 RepID=A0A7E4UWW9_PANRE